jgi:hypothetical protein
MQIELSETQEQSNLKMRKLIFQIYRLCEKQYRKGYQQGYYAGCDNPDGPTDEINEWREEGAESGYRNFIDPHTGQLESEDRRIAQIVSECAMDDMEEIVELLRLYPELPLQP